MPMYNLIEYNDKYSKTPGSLQQYCRVGTHATLTESESFKFKVRITGSAPDDDNKELFEIAVPLTYLNNFWRTLEMPLTNHEIKLILTQSTDCDIFSAAEKIKFAVTDTTLYVPIVTLSTEDNSKLLQQL